MKSLFVNNVCSSPTLLICNFVCILRILRIRNNFLVMFLNQEISDKETPTIIYGQPVLCTYVFFLMNNTVFCKILFSNLLFLLQTSGASLVNFSERTLKQINMELGTRLLSAAYTRGCYGRSDMRLSPVSNQTNLESLWFFISTQSNLEFSA